MRKPAKQKYGMLLGGTVFCLAFSFSTARADSRDDQINAMEQQIKALTAEVETLKQDHDAEKAQAATAPSDTGALPAWRSSITPPQQVAGGAPTPQAAGSATAIPTGRNNPTEPAPSTAGTKSVQVTPGLKITGGGFLAAEAVERSRNETTDVGSNFNNLIPFRNSVNAHQTEFRGSARQSRLSLLAEGTVDENTKLSGYVESDFLGAGTTSNSVESNIYTPRLRVGYATLDKDNWGAHLLAGQEWSLLTMDKVGITPRQEDIPLTIDAQYVPGFNWTRNTQLRYVQDFDDKKIWAGISAESPQVNFGGSTTTLDSNGIAVPAGITATNTGNSPLNSSTTYSTDLAPELIGKLAVDPGWGHYEAFRSSSSFRGDDDVSDMCKK